MHTWCYCIWGSCLNLFISCSYKGHLRERLLFHLLVYSLNDRRHWVQSEEGGVRLGVSGSSWEPGTLSRFSRWVAVTQVLGSPSAAFAAAWTGILGLYVERLGLDSMFIWDVGIAIPGSCLVHCAVSNCCWSGSLSKHYRLNSTLCLPLCACILTFPFQSLSLSTKA